MYFTKSNLHMLAIIPQNYKQGMSEIQMPKHESFLRADSGLPSPAGSPLRLPASHGDCRSPADGPDTVRNKPIETQPRCKIRAPSALSRPDTGVISEHPALQPVSLISEIRGEPPGEPGSRRRERGGAALSVDAAGSWRRCRLASAASATS